MAVGGGGVEALFWVPPVAAGDATDWIAPGVLGSTGGPPASGTVTSVGLALPISVFSISGSPVTTSGTLTGAFVTQTANTLFSGPSSGIDATPTFRSLVTADLPNAIVAGGPIGSSTVVPVITWDAKGRLTAVSTASIASGLTVGSTTISGGTTTRILYDNAGILGEYTNTQLTALINPATATLSGALPAWPNNTTTFFRGDGSYAALPGSFTGFANPTATISTVATNGSATTAMRSDATPALASTISAGGPTGSATVAPIITYNLAGQLTAVSSATITPAVGSITGLGTGVATALSVNVGSAGAFVTFNGALGTPSSGTLTSATGLPISTGVSGLGSGVATALGNTAGGAGGFALVGTTPPTGTAGGDLAGTYPNPTLNTSISTAVAFSGLGATTISAQGASASALTLTGGTVTTSQPLIKGTQTWNNSGVVFAGLTHNVTNTASDAQSALADFQVGGVSRVKFKAVSTSGGGSATAAANVFSIAEGVYVAGFHTLLSSGNSYSATLWTSAATSAIGYAVLGGPGVSNTSLRNVFAIGTQTAHNIGLVTGDTVRWNVNTIGDLFVASSGSNAQVLAFGTAQDLILSRPAAATLQLGPANNASPAAQTVQAVGSRAGTDSNVGGAGLTVTSGNGTGTGTRSVLTLQSPVVVASGTGAQTQTTGWRVDGGTGVSTGYTVATLPATPLTGARAHVTDALAPTFLATIVGGGAITTPVFYNGANWVGG